MLYLCVGSPFRTVGSVNALNICLGEVLSWWGCLAMHEGFPGLAVRRASKAGQRTIGGPCYVCCFIRPKGFDNTLHLQIYEFCNQRISAPLLQAYLLARSCAFLETSEHSQPAIVPLSCASKP